MSTIILLGIGTYFGIIVGFILGVYMFSTDMIDWGKSCSNDCNQGRNCTCKNN